MEEQRWEEAESAEWKAPFEACYTSDHTPISYIASAVKGKTPVATELIWV